MQRNIDPSQSVAKLPKYPSKRFEIRANPHTWAALAAKLRVNA